MCIPAFGGNRRAIGGPSLVLLSCIAVLGAVAATARAAVAQERAGFVSVLGRDTVALEAFTRTASHLDGAIVVRSPGTVLYRYTMDLDSHGAPRRTVVDVQPLAARDGQPQDVTLDFSDGSVRVTMTSQGKTEHDTRAIAAQTSPFLLTGFGASYGLYTAVGPLEAYLSRLPASIGDTVTVPSIDIATARTGPRRFVRRTATQVDADWFHYFWMHLTVTLVGEITAVDASGTTEKTQTQRTAFIDVQAAAKRFAQADRAGHGLGAASPDTIARGTVNGNLVVVTYGSPRRRGRTILGGVVPYEHVWRTGANAATVIVFDHDLNIGGAMVPAGAYSLWTLPTDSDTVTLIINRQHGQWGTDYDPSQDLARVPMRVSTAPTPLEGFTIDITSGDAPQLRMRWDTFVWSVPLR